jgi:molecular chaperone GrpE (heat shock protein)
VTAELLRGYLLHDRVLRPAMVTVAVPPESEDRAAASES